jgi:ATP-dependent Clp protease ATP-binding subunit ClpA
LTDNKGITVNFDDVYFIFTSNIGQKYFNDRSINYEQAVAKAIEDLIEAGVRNELLNRFGGKRNIIGFYSLAPETMIKIVNRELNKTNKILEKSGLKVDLSREEIERIGRDLYSPSNGARAVPGFFSDEVKPKASDIILETPDKKGVIEMAYDEDTKTVSLTKFREEKAKTTPANDFGAASSTPKAAVA